MTCFIKLNKRGEPPTHPFLYWELQTERDSFTVNLCGHNQVTSLSSTPFFYIWTGFHPLQPLTRTWLIRPSLPSSVPRRLTSRGSLTGASWPSGLWLDPAKGCHWLQSWEGRRERLECLLMPLCSPSLAWVSRSWSSHGCSSSRNLYNSMS